LEIGEKKIGEKKLTSYGTERNVHVILQGAFLGKGQLWTTNHLEPLRLLTWPSCNLTAATKLRYGQSENTIRKSLKSAIFSHIKIDSNRKKVLWESLLSSSEWSV